MRSRASAGVALLLVALGAFGCGGGADEAEGSSIPLRSASVASTAASASTPGAPVADIPTTADYEKEVEAAVDPDDVESEVDKLEKEIGAQ